MIKTWNGPSMCMSYNYVVVVVVAAVVGGGGCMNVYIFHNRAHSASCPQNSAGMQQFYICYIRQ